MPLWILAQSIVLTPAQETRVKQIFTPEKIIDISKAIDNEKRQYQEILSLQAKIDSLKTIASKKDVLISKFTSEVLALNKIIRELSSQEDDIADEQLDYVKAPFLGLHLKGRVQTQDIQVDRLMFSVDLSYSFRKLEVGATAWTQYNTVNSSFYYGPFIEYKFF